MPQLVKCLIYKHEDLNSTLGAHIKNKIMKISIILAYICNPSSGEAEIGASLGLANQLV